MEENENYKEYIEEQKEDITYIQYIKKIILKEYENIKNTLTDPKNEKIIIWMCILFLVILVIKYQSVEIGDIRIDSIKISSQIGGDERGLSKKGILSRRSAVKISKDQISDAKVDGKMSVRDERTQQKLDKASLKKRMKTRGFKKTEEGRQIAQDKKLQKLQRKQDIKNARKERKDKLRSKKGPNGMPTGQMRGTGGQLFYYITQALYAIGIFFMIIFIALSPIILYAVLLYTVIKSMLLSFKKNV